MGDLFFGNRPAVLPRMGRSLGMVCSIQRYMGHWRLDVRVSVPWGTETLATAVGTLAFVFELAQNPRPLFGRDRALDDGRICRRARRQLPCCEPANGNAQRVS
jgi:hypothetical protein